MESEGALENPQTLRHYQSLVSIPEPEQVLLLSLQPSHQQYDDALAREFYRRLLERIERLPEVRSASLAREVSVSDASFFTERVAAGRVELGAGTSWTDVAYDAVAPGFFRTMGAGLVRGRDFSARNGESAGPVVIVNETLARRLWPGAMPLGQLLRIDGERSGREVVGVASDRPTQDGPRPFLYEPLLQRDPWAGSRHVLHVRTSVSPLAFVSAVQREAAALDVNLPLFNPRTLDREIAGGRFFERLAGAVEIRLYPIDLGYGLRGANRGVPRLASPALATAILVRLQKMSEPYGTTIAIEHSVGVIRPRRTTTEGGGRP